MIMINQDEKVLTRKTFHVEFVIFIDQKIHVRRLVTFLKFISNARVSVKYEFKFVQNFVKIWFGNISHSLENASKRFEKWSFDYWLPYPLVDKRKSQIEIGLSSRTFRLSAITWPLSENRTHVTFDRTLVTPSERFRMRHATNPLLIRNFQRLAK